MPKARDSIDPSRAQNRTLTRNGRTVRGVDHGDARCAECNGPATEHGTNFCVSFENVGAEVWKHFCSWDHVRAWVSRGEPDWEAEATQHESMTWWGSLGCLAVIAFVMLIFALGLISLVKLTF